MRFEFVRTLEFDENIKILHNTLRYLSNPKNLIIGIFNVTMFLGFYVFLNMLADTYKVIGG